MGKLTEEIATYNRVLPELLPDQVGKWAVVKGAELLGVFVDLGDAFDVVYAHGGPDVCLAREVVDPTDPPVFLAPFLYVPPTQAT
ncbi:MAG: hypothetical protein CMD39_07365 [Gammaproteobacteria bacterium]|nr:hypothetical protein [Gammaproteobacteria bacterium]|tara:strand:+ start:249 stop:503 length:255 start_codon:yes stop_codon:yes gene_type:complete